MSRLPFAVNAMFLIVTLSLLFKSQVHQLLWRIGLLPVWPFLFLLSFWCCFVNWKREDVQEKNVTIVSSLLNLISKGLTVSRTNWVLQRPLGLLLGTGKKTIAGPHVPNDNPRNNCGTHFGSSSSSGASFFAWRRRARNASDWWWTARNDGKGTDGGQSPLSPSRPPLRAHRKRDVWVWGSFGSISFSFLKWRISLRISHFKVPLKTGCAVLCRIAHWDYFGTFLLHSLVITKLRGNRVQNSAPKQ